MRYLPLHIDTKNQTILIAGGGPAAEAKLRTLMKTEATLIVHAAKFSSEITKWAQDGRLVLSSRDITASDIQSAQLVYAATDDPALNTQIATAARALGVLVNAADQKEDCDFFTPAIVDRSPVVISIGTEGTSPGLARAIKGDVEGRLPSLLGSLALKIQELRGLVSQSLPSLSQRQGFWAEILSGNDLASQLKVSGEELTRRVEEKLSGIEAEKRGHVSLVGAGPGKAELLTIGARQKLHSADVIIYDRLVSQDVLDFARREADYIYVGKEPGGESTPQNKINALIVEKAREGLTVVRLKSGDPLIFGRADEEIEALEEAGVSYDILPGITAAAAAAAEIGASLTTRGHNKSISFLTGHDAKGFAEHDWKSLAANGSRAAIYMGVGASRFIQGRLMLHGAPASLPVTVVENASRRDQVILSSTLGSLAQDIESKGIKGPAVLLVGYEAKKGVRAAENAIGAAI
ncbi:MAG: siroheme synthase CysG [Alphaproteobacteria bacterium]